MSEEWGLEPFQGYMIRLDIHSLRICRLLAKTIGFEETIEQADIDEQSELLKRLLESLLDWVDVFCGTDEYPPADYIYYDQTVIVLGSNNKNKIEQLASALQHPLMQCNMLTIRWDSVPEWFLEYRRNIR